MHIFCDLDGVLSNFCQAACDLHRPGATDRWVMDRGRALDPNAHPFEQLHLGLGVHYDAFWQGITNAGEDFWVEMAELPSARELWHRINEVLPDQVSILTSPGAGAAAAGSAAGKYRWVCEQLGPEFTYRTIVCPSPLKCHLAKGADGPNLLIDDYDKNIERWNEAGGVGIQWTSLQFHGRHANSCEVDMIIDTLSTMEKACDDAS